MNVVEVIYTKLPKGTLDVFSKVVFKTGIKSPMGVKTDTRVLFIDPEHPYFSYITIDDVVFIIKHEKGHITIAPITRKLDNRHYKTINKTINDPHRTHFLLCFVYDYIIDAVNRCRDPKYKEMLYKIRDLLFQEFPDENDINHILAEARFSETDEIQGSIARKVRRILDDTQYYPVPKVVIKLYELLRDELGLDKMTSCALICPFAGMCKGKCVFNSGSDDGSADVKIKCDYPHDQEDDQDQGQQGQGEQGKQGQGQSNQQGQQGGEQQQQGEDQQQGGDQQQNSGNQQQQGEDQQQGGEQQQNGENSAEDQQQQQQQQGGEQQQNGTEDQQQQGGEQQQNGTEDQQQQGGEQQQQQGDQQKDEGDQQHQNKGSQQQIEVPAQSSDDDQTQQEDQEKQGQEGVNLRPSFRNLDKEVMDRRIEQIRGISPETDVTESEDVNYQLDEKNPVVQSLSYREREEARRILAQANQGSSSWGNSPSPFNHYRNVSLRVVKALEAMEILKDINDEMANLSHDKKYNPISGEPVDTRDMCDFDEVIDVVDPLELILQEDTDSLHIPQIYERRDEEGKTSILILRDRSGSIKEGSKNEFTKSVVIGLVEMCRKKGIRVGYGEFNVALSLRKVHGKIFTKDYGGIMIYAVSAINDGGTNIPQALLDAVSIIKNEDFKIILISDGESGVPTQSLIDLLRKSNVSVTPIFIGGVGAPNLQYIAENTGGKFYRAERTTTGDAIRIVADVFETTNGY